jgi:ABC-type oligopeptide transport system substrate-binding subunit
MKTTILLLTLLSSALFLSACVNKHGISAKYYSDCKEYYDLQGYYHKECGEDDMVTYKEIYDALKTKEPEPTSNVW